MSIAQTMALLNTSLQGQVKDKCHWTPTVSTFCGCVTSLLETLVGLQLTTVLFSSEGCHTQTHFKRYRKKKSKEKYCQRPPD